MNVTQQLSLVQRLADVEAEVRALLPTSQQPAYAKDEVEMTKARDEAIKRR